MVFDFRLQVFYTVAHRLSFTKAAEELFVTQPAVTKHIRGLEQQFQVKLFERRGNNIRLTEGGELLLRYADELMRIYNRLEQDMNGLSGSEKGCLAIGASTTLAQYVIPEMLAAFRKKYSDITVTLTTGNTEDIEQALLKGTIDIGFIEGHTRNKQIRYLPFRKDEIVLIGRADHAANKKTLKPSELQTMPLLMREPGSGTLEVVQLALKKTGIKLPQLNIEMQLDSTEAIKSYVLHSDCAAFVSRYAIQQELAQSVYKIWIVQGLKIERPLHLIHLQGALSRLPALFLKYVNSHNKK
jgi:LysR family transcriptional regulator, transcriptional activator of the cysJI operon